MAKNVLREELLRENEELKARLEELEETLRAVRSGEVDALVVSTSSGDRVFTLEGANQSYRTLIEGMKEGAAMLSDDGTVLYCNSGLASMVDMPLDKIVGVNIRDLISSSHLDGFRQFMAQGRKSEKPVTKEITLKSKSGEFVPTLMSFNRLGNEGAAANYLVVTDLSVHMEEDLKRYTDGLEREVQRRIKLEKALRHSEKKHRRLYETLQDGIMARDLEGRMIDCNNAYTCMLGYSQKELKKLSIKDLLPEKWHEQREKMAKKVLEEGVSVVFEREYRRKDGSIFPASVRTWQLTDEEGKVIGIWSIVRDITTKKKAEDALKKINEELEERVAKRTADVLRERKRLYSILETLPAYVVLLDKNYRISFTNKVFRERFGEPRDRRCYEYLFDFSSPCENCETYKVLKTNLPHHWEWTGPDGRNYDIYDFPFIEPDGSTIILEMGIDITERKKAETALVAERKRFFDVLETLPVMVCLFTEDYHVAYANVAFRERFGESMGKRCYEYCYGQSAPCDFCESYNVLKTGKPHHWVVHSPDGSVIDVYDFPFTDVDGSRMVLELDVDITEQKRAEERLLAASLYTRSLLESSLDPLVTISAEGKITDVNHATESVTGFSRDLLIGSDFSDYFTEPEVARKVYMRVYAEGFVRDYPLAIRDKSGKITQVLYNASLYRNEKGEVLGVVAAARDVTELRRVEEKAREAAEKLEDAKRLAIIGATAGMVGHDIRNPLQAIVGDLYLVKSDLADLTEGEVKEGLQESLMEIEKNVDYINKIVQDLQDFAKPLKPSAKETDVENTCQEVLSKIGIPANINASYEVDAKAKKLVADPDLLTRILSNLVSNAVQAMPNGGQLEIQAFKDVDAVVVTVEDTGVGISEEVKSKLFTPLFTTKSKGQGFGLAVVKRMTEALGGSVTFESKVGEGTKFIVRLPPPKKS